MEYFADLSFAAWMIAVAVWGVNRRWYPGIHGARRYRNDPNAGWVYVGWRKQTIRVLALFIAAAALLDFWYRATGRGPFLH